MGSFRLISIEKTHRFATNHFLLILGEITPLSATGKLIGGFCAIFGVFTITLPVPIMVNSFSNFYKNRLWRGEVAMRRRERHLAEAVGAGSCRGSLAAPTTNTNCKNGNDTV